MALGGSFIPSSPDEHGAGLTGAPLDGLRYDGQSDHPREIAGMMHDLMPDNVRVLDVGCGTGSVTLIANRGRGTDVIAIEPDAERAAVARSRGLTVHTGFLDDAFLTENGRFDVVMSSDVLEHLAAPADFLAMVMRAAKPGGLLLISVPNVAHWSVRLSLLAGRFEYEPVGIMDATHLRWFTASSLRALLRQAGAEPLEMRQTAGVELPIYHRRLLGRLPSGVKARGIRAMTCAAPLLFGVQHVVKARVKG